VWVKQDILAKLWLTIQDVIKAIQDQNEIVLGGQFGGSPSITGNQFAYTVRLQDRVITGEEF
jgi:multidrug efflux pump subunit AcrB